MIKKLTGLLSVIFLMSITSCSSDGDATSEAGASISATLNGQAWRSISGGAMANLSTVEVDGENKTVLMIIGAKLDQSALTIQFPVENLTEGTYTFNADNNAGSITYVTAAMNMYNSSETGGSCSITVTDFNIETGRMSGTFSGTLKDFSGNTMTVTDGEFSSIKVMSSNMYSNGTMSLSRNGGTAFTMDDSSEDGKHLMITENSEAENVSIFGYNTTLTSDAGIYNITMPIDVTPGTYNLMTTAGFDAGIGNAENEAEYNLTSGTLTVTSHSGSTLAGTFSYTASNGTQTVTVTNGSFSITHN